MPWKVSYFPQVEKFRKGLPKPVEAKVLSYMNLLKTYGPDVTSPFSKKLSNNLFELRVRGSNAIRLIYCFSKKRIVILHAFKKKTNKIPQRELKTAVDRMKQII